MKINWIIEESDIKIIEDFVDTQIDKSFVKYRIEKNVNGPPPPFNKNIFWEKMTSCLLTTQQRSGPDSSVTKFICTKPYPLDLDTCRDQTNLEGFVKETITNFGGLRRGNRIGQESLSNFKWLESGGWNEIEGIARHLLEYRKREPQESDLIFERKASNFVLNKMKGFGPKQSRNLWQALGLTRFEIPIDSRITKWLNDICFPIKLSATALSEPNYYDFVMDGIQQICSNIKIYPCVLDAVIFTSFDRQEWPEEKLIW